MSFHTAPSGDTSTKPLLTDQFPELWALSEFDARADWMARHVDAAVRRSPNLARGLVPVPKAVAAVLSPEDLYDPNASWVAAVKRLAHLSDAALLEAFGNPACGVLFGLTWPEVEFVVQDARDPTKGDVIVNGERIALSDPRVASILKARSKPRDFDGFNVIRHYGNQPVVGGFDAHGKFQHQTFGAFKASYSDKVVWREGKAVPLAAEWLARSPRYDSAEFLPGLDAPDGVLNLWSGWKVRPSWGGDFPLLSSFIIDVMCGGDCDVAEWFTGWLADLVKNPHRTSEVAVVMSGPMGSGKSLFANFLGELVAPHYVVLEKPDQLVGRFNTHLMTACLVFADEAFFAGNKQAANTLKTLVTSPEIFVEPKGIDGFMARKSFRLLFASNDEHVVDAAMDDRRYLVLNVDAGENNKRREFFEPLIAEWRDGGREAFFAFLRRYDLSAWHVQDRPVTAGLRKQRELSLRGPEAVVATMLRDGDVPCDFEVAGDGAVFVPTALLAERTRLDLARDLTALGRLLGELSDEVSQRAMVGRGPARRQLRGFWLPSLSVCRERFGRGIDYTGCPETWDVDAEVAAEAREREAQRERDKPDGECPF